MPTLTSILNGQRPPPPRLHQQRHIQPKRKNQKSKRNVLGVKNKVINITLAMFIQTVGN
jgi:hypothetical protein